MKTFISIIVIVIVLIAGALIIRSKKTGAPASTALPASNQASQNTTMNTQNTPSKNPSANTPALSGIQSVVLKEGSGDRAVKVGDSVSVNYTGTLTNGTVFDSNVLPKFGHITPFTFTVGGHMVIRGWDEGLIGMKVGEKRKLTLAPEYAYGAVSPSPLIPANSTLIFEVEVTAIK